MYRCIRLINRQIRTLDIQSIQFYYRVILRNKISIQPLEICQAVVRKRIIKNMYINR